MKEELVNKTLKVKVVVKDVITQADLEAFQKEFWKMSAETPSAGRSANVLSAVRSGWIEELHLDDKRVEDLTAEGVGQMDPRAVMFISNKVDALYKEFTSIPKN